MKHHLLLMDEDGMFGERTLLSVSFPHPPVNGPDAPNIEVDQASFSQLTPEQAAQVITSAQEDYEQTS